MEAPGSSWKKVSVAVTGAPEDVLSTEMVMSLPWDSCSSRLSPAPRQGGSPVLPSSGQALSPSSEAAEKVAASARSTSSVLLSPTAQPAWDSSQGSGAGPGLPGRSHSPKSEAPGRRQLKVQVSGARRWGLLGPFALSRGCCWAPASTRVSGGGLRHTL